MRVNGIIAEYNPFHNGHKHHIMESKKNTNADYTIVVMSGNFVQRGTPALLSKHHRTKMALLNGADLVLELPSFYATASAEYFATGAVSLLNRLNIVDYLCFGTESGDLTPLSKAANIIEKNSIDFQKTLKQALIQGLSYPAARTEALIRCEPEFAKNVALFNSSNNILAIEYLKALIRFDSKMIPCTVKRLGSDYNDPQIKNIQCSALAIRQALSCNNDISLLSSYMPEESVNILSQTFPTHTVLSNDCLSLLLYYKLLSEAERGYTDYLDVSKELSDRIRNSLKNYKDYNSFCELLKTKEITFSRISRCLLHILLNITKEELLLSEELSYTPYARVLGFRKDAGSLLSSIKQNSAIPLITKLADAHQILDENEYYLLKKDVQNSQLYYGLLAQQNHSPMLNEYTIPIVIV